MQSLAFSSTTIAGARAGTRRERAAVRGASVSSQTRGASVSSPAVGAFPVSLGRRVRAAAAADAAADSAAALDALLGVVPELPPSERAEAAAGRACQILPVPAPSSNAFYRTFVP